MLEQKLVDKVPWTVQQTFTGILLTLLPWIAFSLAVSGFTTRTTGSTPTLTPRLDLINAIITFFISAIIESAFLIAPLYFANRAFRSRAPRGRLVVDALGFRSFRIGMALTWVIALFLAFLAINVLYQAAITTLHLHLQTNDQVILEESKRAPITTYATLLVAVFIAPICEEVFFRSFAFMGFLNGMSVLWAVILSALVFGVAHGDPASFAVLFCIGLALAVVRWRTQSIWPGIFLHFLNNGLSALLIVLTMTGLVHQ